jgi:hypothetical protein
MELVVLQQQHELALIGLGASSVVAAASTGAMVGVALTTGAWAPLVACASLAFFSSGISGVLAGIKPRDLGKIAAATGRLLKPLGSRGERQEEAGKRAA